VDAGDAREFREYVAGRQASLFRSALLMTGHRQEAEDLVQSALARVAQHWKRVGRYEHLDAYVRRIMYHEHISWWRRRGGHRESSMDRPPDCVAPGDFAASTALRLSLAQALRRLPTRQRAAVVLRYYVDLPEGDVASIMGCSVGSVRSHTSRGLARLRRLCPDLALTARPEEVAL
jgi:RNA polymerase sigma-70 factor (sigma-E family)